MISPVYPSVKDLRRNKPDKPTPWLLVFAVAFYGMIVPTPKAWAQG